MKRMAAILLAAALCAAAALPAFAVEISEDVDYDTTLRYMVDADYLVVVPESIALDQELVISSTRANTEPGMAVKVRISNLTADGKAELSRINDTDYKITAQAKQNDAAIADGVFTSVVYNEQIVTGTQTPLTVDIAKEEWEEAKSGEYEARLTFTISYTNPHDAQDQPADEP